MVFHACAFHIFICLYVHNANAMLVKQIQFYLLDWLRKRLNRKTDENINTFRKLQNSYFRFVLCQSQIENVQWVTYMTEIVQISKQLFRINEGKKSLRLHLLQRFKKTLEKSKASKSLNCLSKAKFRHHHHLHRHCHHHHYHYRHHHYTIIIKEHL